jgi:hypothetical protein
MGERMDGWMRLKMAGEKKGRRLARDHPPSFVSRPVAHSHHTHLVDHTVTPRLLWLTPRACMY